MAATRSVLPLIALVSGALLLSSKKASAASKSTSSGKSPPPPPHNLEVPALFTVRSGDVPHKVAAYYTGDGLRFKEMQYVSGPQMNLPKGEWFPGTVVLLPASWRAFSRPLPVPNSVSQETSPPEFPESA